MARKTILVEQEQVTCDRCGKPLTKDDVNEFYLTARGMGTWDHKEHIVFEGGLIGDYCNECLEKIQKKVLDKLGDLLWERYDDVKEEKPDERIWKMIDEEE